MIQNKTVTPEVVGEPSVLKGIEACAAYGLRDHDAKGRPAETMLAGSLRAK